MYTLRRISGSGSQFHFALGKSYTYLDRHQAPEDFKSTMNSMYGGESSDGNIYAFVGDHGGENIYPLYEGQAAFIMTESGKTFANVSWYGNPNDGEVTLRQPK